MEDPFGGERATLWGMTSLSKRIAAVGAAVVLAVGGFVALDGKDAATPDKATAAAACTTTISPGTSIATATTNLAPGAVLCLRGGTYTENVAINSAGTSASPKTIRSADGERATIQPPTGRTTDQYALRVRGGAAYWVIEDITFRGAYAPVCSAWNVWVLGAAHDITFRGAEFTGSTGGSGFGTDSTTDRIYVYASSSHDNVDSKNCNGVQAHGYYIQGKNSVIARSLAYNHPDGGWGIQGYPTGDRNIYSQNTLVKNANGAFVLKQTNTQIVNNIGYQNGGSSVSTGGSSGGRTGCVIANNILNGSTYPSECAKANNTAVDPKFVSPTDFHLQGTSPALNNATAPTYAPDYDGKPNAGIPDRGAFELQATTPDPDPDPTPTALTEGCTGGVGTTTTLAPNTVYDRKRFTHCQLRVAGANTTVQNSQIVGLGGQNAVENPDVQIYVNGGTNFKLINSEVKDNAWEAGLYADGNASLTIQNSDFHDNGARTNNGTSEDLSNRAHNIYLSDVSSALVENSRFTGARAFGMQIYPGTNDRVTIRHNYIANNGKSGIIVGGNNTGIANLTNSAFTDNAITGNGQNGIQAYRLGTGTGNVFAPNYIWGNSGPATSGISGTQNLSAPPAAWLTPPQVRY